MKKMMIIAVMIGALLMPAQSFAQNRKMDKGERKVQIDKRKGDDKKRNNANRGGKEFKVNKNGAPNKHIGKQPMKHPAPRPVVIHKPAPRPVIVHNHHIPAPPPAVHCPVVHHHCNNDVAEATTIVLGIAGIISMLSN